MPMDLMVFTATGRLGSEPEIRALPTGTNVTSFRIAISGRKGPDGQHKTLWRDCVCFGKLAELASSMLHKGSRIAITGEEEDREWTDKQTGEKRTKPQIVLSTFVILDAKSTNSTSAAPAYDDVPF